MKKTTYLQYVDNFQHKFTFQKAFLETLLRAQVQLYKKQSILKHNLPEPDVSDSGLYQR